MHSKGGLKIWWDRHLNQQRVSYQLDKYRGDIDEEIRFDAPN
jgi:hypothetical protein